MDQENKPMADKGLMTVASQHRVKTTLDRLETAAKAKGMIIFARIDHAAGATSVGLPLRPTELLIFGNARGGTPLMQLAQTIGIDLPLKALVFEDAAGKVWLSYNEPGWLAQRHGLGVELQPTINGMAAALRLIASKAAGVTAPS